MLGGGDQLNQGNAHLASHLDGGAGGALLHDQGLGIEVVQIKLELISAVGRVQRSRRATTGHGDEAGGHVGTVGQHQRHTVIAANADTVELRLDVLGQ